MADPMTFEVAGLDPVEEFFRRSSKFDGAPILESIGEAIVAQSKLRIKKTKKTPDGEPLMPWSPDYALTRTQPPHSLLIDTGDLLESIAAEVVGERRVEVEPKDIDYAAAVQFYSDGREKRPYMGIGAEDMRELQKVALDGVAAWMGGLG